MRPTGWGYVQPPDGVQISGAARVAGVDLRIRPKLPIARLFFLLGCARDSRWWRDDDVDVSDSPDLMAAAAEALPGMPTGPWHRDSCRGTGSPRSPPLS